MSLLKEVIENIFDESYKNIEALESFSEFDDWDSLMYVSLIANIEKSYNIELKRDEIQRMVNVGSIEKVLKERNLNDAWR